MTRSYFEKIALEERTYPLLERPCGECAVVDGFYKEIADELLKEAREIQDANLERWFCHCHPDKACRGAFNYINVKRRQEDKHENQ